MTDYIETNRIKFIDTPAEKGAPPVQEKPKAKAKRNPWLPSPKVEQLIARFKAQAGEFGRFDRIEKPLSRRPDIHAMLMLDQLQPKKGPLIKDNTHGEVYFDIDMESLQDHVTDDQIRDLVRCGVLAHNVGVIFPIV